MLCVLNKKNTHRERLLFVVVDATVVRVEVVDAGVLHRFVRLREQDLLLAQRGTLGGRERCQRVVLAVQLGVGALLVEVGLGALLQLLELRLREVRNEREVLVRADDAHAHRLHEIGGQRLLRANEWYYCIYYGRIYIRALYHILFTFPEN